MITDRIETRSPPFDIDAREALVVGNPRIGPLQKDQFTDEARELVEQTRAQFGVLAGADYTLHRHIDFRVIEVGYSSLSTVSSYTNGSNLNSYPASRLLSFSTGLVFRFR